MWFATRDLIFGKDKFPLASPPESIGRVKQGREIEAIPVEHETLISFLMNLLMIEVRAERAFRFYESVIGNADVFLDKQEEAKHGVMMVNRIRMDENIHVAWLKVAISEFRNFTIKKNDGTQVKGATLLDPIWEKWCTGMRSRCMRLTEIIIMPKWTEKYWQQTGALRLLKRSKN